MERSPCSAQTAVTTARGPGDAGPERGAEEEGAKKKKKLLQQETLRVGKFGSEFLWGPGDW